VLALDEVWDPQNFGALLRTAYFLKCDKVVVCSKNSAPLSPAVSRASAGAMEIMKVYSTDNMMKFLDKSKDNGWQVTALLLCLCVTILLTSLKRSLLSLTRIKSPFRLYRWWART